MLKYKTVITNQLCKKVSGKLTADFWADADVTWTRTVEYVGLVADALRFHIQHVWRVVSCVRQEREISHPKAQLLACNVDIGSRPTTSTIRMNESMNE